MTAEYETPSWLRSLWYTGLVLLPLTTPAFMPFGSALVRPPALLLFGVIALVVCLHPELRRRLWADSGIRLALVFVGWAVLVSIPALITSGVVCKGGSTAELCLRAGATLAAGLACYIATRTMLRTNADLDRAWPPIMIGLGGSVVWAGVQWLAYSEQYWPTLGPVISNVSFFLSGTRGPDTVHALAQTRPHGFAYEPSWLASQLLLLAVPVGMMWLGHHTGWRRALGGTSVLLALFAVSIGSSRIGMATIAVASLVGVAVSWPASWRVRMMLCGIIVLTVATAGALATRSAYFHETIGLAAPGRVVPTPTADWPVSPGVYSWAWRSNFVPRIAAAHTAIRLASVAPITGIGLGQYGSRFPSQVPVYGTQHAEVRAWCDPDPTVGRVPNAKNMPLRIAAETGFIGLVLWLVFISWHWLCGWGVGKWRGLAVVTAVALVGDWVSLDSFALPQVWLALGILVASRPCPPST